MIALIALVVVGGLIWYSYRAYEEMKEAAEYWLRQWRIATQNKEVGPALLGPVYAAKEHARNAAQALKTGSQ